MKKYQREVVSAPLAMCATAGQHDVYGVLLQMVYFPAANDSYYIACCLPRFQVNVLRNCWDFLLTDPTRFPPFSSSQSSDMVSKREDVIKERVEERTAVLGRRNNRGRFGLVTFRGAGWGPHSGAQDAFANQLCFDRCNCCCC